MQFFAQKQALHHGEGPIPHGAAPYEEFFSWGSRHHYPVEVGSAYGNLCTYRLHVDLYRPATP